eukprot:4912151-Alexandrium_andersonii.AAC.1
MPGVAVEPMPGVALLRPPGGRGAVELGQGVSQPRGNFAQAAQRRRPVLRAERRLAAQPGHGETISVIQ